MAKKKKLKKDACLSGYGVIKQRIIDKNNRMVHVTKDAETHIAKRHPDVVRYLPEIKNILSNYDEIEEDNREHGTLYYKTFDTEDGKHVKILLVTHGCVDKPDAGNKRRVNHVSTMYDYDRYKRGC